MTNNATQSLGRAQGNESKIRLTAFWVCALTVWYSQSGSLWIPALLVVDFSLRSFDLGRFSPLSAFSGWLVRAFRLPVKPVYMPPKRFAARIGLLFSIAILCMGFFKVNALPVVATMILFAALESFAGFCAGCYVYAVLLRIKIIK